MSKKISQLAATVPGNAGALIPQAVGGANYSETINNLGGGIDPRWYGAVGNGSTNDAAAMLLAIAAGVAAGKPVIGHGRTYGITGNLTLVAGAWVQDCSFKQLTPSGGSRRTLTSSGASNIKLVRVIVNRNGTGANGSLGNDAGIWIEGGSGHYFEDVEVYGDDIGSGFTLQTATRFDVVRLHVHDIKYLLGSNPGDDRVQGFWLNNCSDFRVVSPRIHDLGGNYGSGATTRWSRNTLGGCDNFDVVDALVANVDQGIDLSGSVGNTNFRIIGGNAKDCYTWGWKFSSSARYGTVTGSVAERCGFAGFVASGPSEAALPVKTGDILFEGCTAYDTASNGFWSANSNAGFLVQQGAFDIDLPRGIRFIDCRAIDRQAGKTMKYGFRNEVPANVDGRYNECTGCIALGYTVQAFLGMNAPRCTVALSSVFSLPNNAWTTVSWNVEDDRGEMHDTVTNSDTFFPRRTGHYLFNAGVEFAANATGQRGIRLQFNGSVIPGTTVLVGAAAAGTTALHTAISRAFTLTAAGASRFVRVEAFQNSGAALSLQTTSGAVLEQVSFDGDE